MAATPLFAERHLYRTELGAGGSLRVVRGAGFGVLGFSGEEEPWPGGIRPQGDAWEIPGGVLRLLGTAWARRGDGNVLVTLKIGAVARLLPHRCGAGVGLCPLGGVTGTCGAGEVSPELPGSDLRPGIPSRH